MVLKDWLAIEVIEAIRDIRNEMQAISRILRELEMRQ